MKKLSESYKQEKYDNELNLPPVESLGDGVYEGALWGHCFAHNGKQYYCKIGTKNIYPYKIKITIKEGEQKPFEFIDKFQHKSLKSLFESANQPELPPIEILGDGEYEGALWGSTFAYNGKEYLCKCGLLNIFPCMVKITIKNEEVVLPYTQIDDCQRPELKSLFK